jgi:hypothetical protein
MLSWRVSLDVRARAQRLAVGERKRAIGNYCNSNDGKDGGANSRNSSEHDNKHVNKPNVTPDSLLLGSK